MAESSAGTSGAWRARPVFVSSTFRDMQAERDHLARIVFPRLEEKLRERRHHLEPIDLRVGVDTTAVADDQGRELLVLKVCFEEIKRSRPFLLVLLGDRYGWVPPARRVATAIQEAGIAAPIEALEHRSVTAMEIEFGLLKTTAEQKRRCLFYLREPLPYHTMPPALAAQYSDGHSDDPGAARRADDLQQLKSALRADSALRDRIHSYTARWDPALQRVTGLESWGEMVFSHLWAELDEDTADFVRRAPPTWDQTERDALVEFVEHRTRGFVGRDDLIDKLVSLAKAKAPPTAVLGACITGEPGSGKSALFARLHQLFSVDAGVLLLSHAAGISPRAANVELMLRRWTGELASFLQIENPLTQAPTAGEIEQAFASLLAKAAQSTRVVVLVDALNQFQNTTRAREVTWFRGKSWPLNARLIATALPGMEAEAVAGWAGVQEIDLPPLGTPEAELITRQVWSRYHRAVSPNVVAELTAKRLSDDRLACGNPLWLTLANEQLNLLDADDFARADQDYSYLPESRRLPALIADNARRLPADMRGLYGEALEFARRVHGPFWTAAFASVMAFSRSGWRESDLLALVPRIAMMLAVTSEFSKARQRGEGLPADSPQEKDAMQRQMETVGGMENGAVLMVAAIRRTFRAHLMQRGGEGQWDFFHAQAREAMTDLIGIDPTQVRMVHLEIARYLQSLRWSDRLAQSETMHHLIQWGDTADAAGYCCRVAALGITKLGLDGRTKISVAALQESMRRDPRLREIDALLGDQSILDLDAAGIARAVEESAATLAKFIIVGEQPDPESPNAHLEWVASWLQKEWDEDDAPGNQFELRQFFNDALVPAMERQGAAALGSRLAEAVVRSGPPINDPEGEDVSVLHNRQLAEISAGDQLRSSGESTQALSHYQQALQCCRVLVRREPSIDEYARDMAVALDRVGVVCHDSGDYSNARTHLAENYRLSQLLLGKSPDDPRAGRDMRWSCTRLAILEQATGRPAESLEYWRQAIAALARVRHLEPGHLDDADGLAKDCLRAGILCSEEFFDPERAVGFLQQGLEAARWLVSQEPDQADYVDTLAMIRSKLSDCHMWRGDLEASVSECEAVLEMRQDLHSRHPTDAHALDMFLSSCLKSANMGLVMGDPARAKTFLAKFRGVFDAARRNGTRVADQVGPLVALETMAAEQVASARPGQRISSADLQQMVRSAASDPTFRQRLLDRMAGKLKPHPAAPIQPRREMISDELRKSAAISMRWGRWEAAAMDLENLLARGEPLSEHAPALIACLLNAHDKPLPADVLKIESLLNQLEATGHTVLAAPLREQLNTKRGRAKKPWWKVW